jgi:Uma2 family endonuclease
MDTLVAEKFETLTQPLYMTEEEFLEFCDEDTRAEYIDGEVIVHSPGSYIHENISGFLLSLLRFFVDQHQLGFVPGSNFQIRLRPGLRRVPDLIFVSKENEQNIARTELEGSPDLAVEIVSLDSFERDWRDKYFEYEQAGIREYWVVDPNSQQMKVYCLNEQGKFESQQAEKGIFKSKVLPGFWIKPEWLWQDPLPNVISIAKELKIKI